MSPDKEVGEAMQKETDRICQQMKQAFDGPAWHGPSLMEILDGVDATLASARPIPGAHTVWEIVLHLTSTHDVLLRRLHGDATPLTPEEDWPAPPKPSESAWRSALDGLRNRDRELRTAIAGFPDERLDEQLMPGGTSAYNNFHGHVQHNLYHAAQIGFLKKMTSS